MVDPRPPHSTRRPPSPQPRRKIRIWPKAPQQLGIGIRRHFTDRGTHPYDTVEWEKRDARIPNFKDGGDAFFQADVEFPKSWSVNATNIVAQKYFRGTLGYCPSASSRCAR